MSRFKTKSKQALTILLALLLFFAMVPSTLPGGLAYADEITYTNTSTNRDVEGFPNDYGPVISSDKAVYKAGENIYIKVENSSSATAGGWIGIYDSVNVDPKTTTLAWAYTGETTVADVTDYIIYGPDKNAGVIVNTPIGYGTRYIIFMASDGRWAVLPIEIEDDTDIQIDKEGAIPQYKYGEPVLVTAQSSDSSAWVGVFDYAPDFPDGYYARFDVKDVTGSVDLVKLASDAGKPLGYGKQYRTYICHYQDGDPNHWVKQVKFELLVTYLDGDSDIDWTLSEDKTTATAVLHRGDDPTQTITLTTTDVTDNGVTTEPTCTEAGEHQYTAKAALQDGDLPEGAVTKNDLTEFTHVFKESIAALGHSWGEWTVVTPPTDLSEGLERRECSRCDATEERAIPSLGHIHKDHLTKVPAKAPTCTEAGNSEYYTCTCGLYFNDAEATTEIENNSWVIAALGHKFGEWSVTTQPTCTEEGVETRECSECDATETRAVSATGHDWGKPEFDPETRTHTSKCANDPTHVKTEACTFDEGKEGPDPDMMVYTCTVCGGQYEQLTIPVITTDKTEYKVGEEIKVTTEMNGYSGDRGWVALYPKGSSYYTSMYWFYPDCFDKERPLLPTGDDYNTDNENFGSEEVKAQIKNGLPVGEYELVYVTYPEKPYQLVGHPTYFTVVKGIKSEEVTKEPTCTEKGIKHIVYDDGTTADEEIPALGHDPKEAWVHDAEKRTHYHECSRCDAHIDEAACTFDEGKVTKEATATEEGEMLYTCTVCGGTYTEAIPTLANQGVKRVYGDTRFQTALLQANELKEFLGLEKFPSIIVATGANYADALSGAYLGYVKGAPILLVQNSKSDVIADVNAYIKDNIAPGGTVYLLGGEAVVTEDVTKGLDVTTKRLFGATRYETNIKILEEAKVNKESILVCDGNNYADSLSASAAKLPILLVKGGLNDTQRDYLNTLPGNDYYLVGGTGVLPVALENELKSDFGAVERLGGADRYETSTKVAEKFFEKPEKAVVAYAMNYPDGLCGGTLAAYMNAPLLLVRNNKVDITEKYSKAAGIKSGIVLGGSTLVSDEAVRVIFEMAEEDEIYVVNKMVPMTE